ASRPFSSTASAPTGNRPTRRRFARSTSSSRSSKPPTSPPRPPAMAERPEERSGEPDGLAELAGSPEPTPEQLRALMRPMVQRTREEMGFDVLPPRIRENSPYLGEYSLVDLLGFARANRAEAEAAGKPHEAELWATAERHLAGYVRFLEEMGRDPTRK